MAVESPVATVGSGNGGTDSLPAKPGLDQAPRLRLFLALDVGVRLLLWCGALTAATGLMSVLGLWPATAPAHGGFALAWTWAWRIALWVVLFNVAYILEIVVLRVPIPTPQPGRYSTTTRRPAPAILYSCLIALLSKARYEPPFPGFLVFQLANLPPLHWPVRRLFGPRSRSCYATEPRILDPHLVTIGRNVTVGYDVVMTAHLQEREAVIVDRIVIEDDALIGGLASLTAGVRVGRGAVVGAAAHVPPGTIIGPNEFWGGVPARKIRTLDPVNPMPTQE